MILEKILGSLFVSDNLARSGRNFTALETEFNDLREQNNSLDAKIGTIESQTIVENYLSAHSIPSTAKRGKLDVKLKGMSAMQSVINGNFANGTTGWTGSGATLSASNNILSNTGNGAFVQPLCYGVIKTVTNSKYYRRAKVRVTNASCLSLRVRIFDGVNYLQQIISSPIQNQWYDSSVIVTALNASSSAQLEILHVYADAATSNGKVMEVQNVICINLTALFGAGNEPTKEQCDKMFANYFDGLQGTSNIAVKSTGKNLFDGVIIDGFYLDTATGTNVGANATRSYSPNYCSIKPSTQYYFSASSSTATSWYIFFYDSNKNYISQASNFNPYIAFTTPSNACYFRLAVVTNAGNLNSIGTKIQLEEGTVATAYESYKSTEVTYKTLDGQSITLHRLPNGVRDEITDDGKFIKRVGEYILQASDITTLTTTGTNVDIVSTKTLATDGNTWSHLKVNSIVVGNYEQTTHNGGTNWDNTSLIGKVYGNVNILYFPVAKGTYANLITAQTALAGTKIIYELAQPKVFDTNAIPLVAEPSGTVFISTTSPQPSVELSYPVNIGAVIDGLIEGQKEHSERFNNLDKTDWIAPTLLNTWSNFGGNYSNVGFYKDEFGIVHLRGLVKSGVIGAAVFNLPEGYRPSKTLFIAVSSNSLFGLVQIDSTGAVAVSVGNNTWVSLENISFKAGV